MSSDRFRTTVLFLGLMLLIVEEVRAQDTQVNIALNGVRARVSISSSFKSKEWSFRNSYAGALGLGDRVEELSARGARLRKVASGEFRAEDEVSAIEYQVRLDQVRPGDLAHVSWLSDGYGFLMLGDLLPEAVLRQRGLQLKLALPIGWNAYGPVESSGDCFVVDNPDDAVFFAGKKIRINEVKVKESRLRLVVNGDWKFKDKDALKFAEKVFSSYLDLTKFVPSEALTIFAAPIPTSTTSSQWKAETRGSTVVLLLNKQTDIKNWLGQLGIIFTHELFHLWVPNSLKLQGSYDWFFEGFTLYVALQTALKLNLIKFEEYLATMARVYDSYLSYADSQSLVAASEARWTTPGSLVYDKGMLVAFLYDLKLRNETLGRETLRDKYRSLFLPVTGRATDANEVIIDSLSSSAATGEILKSYVVESRRIELPSLLMPFGLDVDVGGPNSMLRVRRDITPDQLNLLKSLGYRR